MHKLTCILSNLVHLIILSEIKNVIQFPKNITPRVLPLMWKYMCWRNLGVIYLSNVFKNYSQDTCKYYSFCSFIIGQQLSYQSFSSQYVKESPSNTKSTKYIFKKKVTIHFAGRSIWLKQYSSAIFTKVVKSIEEKCY